MIKLRPYQQEAVDAAVNWMKSNTLGGVVDASGGFGKSIVIAEVARIMHELSGKYVLCLVPNAELLTQNCEKLEAIGCKFSTYSASVGKSLRHPIVVATEGTWKSVAKEYGAKFGTVLVDEGDRTTATLKKIMDDMREENPMLRLCAFTGTPYRLKTGWIFEVDLNNKLVDETVDPFYKKLIYRLGCDELISMSYLTPVTIGTPSNEYDTSNLKLSGEDFTPSSIRNTFECHESVTHKIVNDIVEKTKDRNGVMIFAATLKHAEDIIKYLPKDDYLFVHGEMNKGERKEAIRLFKQKKKKYIVNRDILTVGFDAPHVDCIALMRATSSNRLFQQIVWRGVRLSKGKQDCLLLDYARNIENLFDGSHEIFTPSIKAYGSKPSEKISVTCEQCGTDQEHSKRNGYENWDQFGYVIDLAGDRNVNNIPAHYGRRCIGIKPLGKNKFERCDYFWSHKECPACQHKNDIAARNCESCGFNLINPDDKLTDTATYIPIGERMTTRVNGMDVKKSTDGSVAYVTFNTQHGDIKCRFFPTHAKTHIARHWWAFKRSTEDSTIIPKYIEYTRQESGYCSINRYMREGLAG